MTQGMALITFETRAVEDRAASIKAGHWVGKDIDVALITPVGGKHTHEQEVTEELLRRWKLDKTMQYRHDAYHAWKEGAEPPVNGASLRDWPPISPAQLKILLSRNIRSVEELAELPDDSLQSFGPGFRGIRDKAREWIKSSSDIGRAVAEMSVLREELEAIKEENAKKDTLIDKLMDQLEEKPKTKRKSA